MTPVGAAPSTRRLAVLLPITSRGASSSFSVLRGLRTLAASLHQHADSLGALPLATTASAAPPLVLLGIDHDDEPLLLRQQECESVFKQAGADAETRVFSPGDLRSAAPDDDGPPSRRPRMRSPTSPPSPR